MKDGNEEEEKGSGNFHHTDEYPKYKMNYNDDDDDDDKPMSTPSTVDHNDNVFFGEDYHDEDKDEVKDEDKYYDIDDDIDDEGDVEDVPKKASKEAPTTPPINLYDETMEMWEISTMMFFLSKMRNWARDNELFNDSHPSPTNKNSKTKRSRSRARDQGQSQGHGQGQSRSFSPSSLRERQRKVKKKRHRILGRVIRIDDILHTMEECYDCLKEKEPNLSNGTPRVDLHIHVMQSIRKRTRNYNGSKNYNDYSDNNHDDDDKKGDSDDGFLIVNFDDSREDEEIVPAIIVDKHRKRIVVAFRGSQSRNDWIVNLSCVQTREVNPMHLLKMKERQHQKQPSTSRGNTSGGVAMNKMIWKQPKTILLHTGFYHSIFGEKSRYGNLTKYQFIMKKTLEVLKEYPGYRLDVTGLSLGGALCQMFSLYAAAETNPIIKKPVTCYSFASPKIGALTYRRAVQALEESGNLRLLRVLNEHDFVSLYPRDPLSMCCISGLSTLSLILRQGLYYRKAGMEIKFLDGGGVGITHPKVPPRKVDWNLFHFNLFRYDMERQWERQTKCCGCIYELLTPDDDDDNSPSYREQHGYPFYYLQIQQRMQELKKYTLEGLYSASLHGDTNIVEPIYS